MTEVGIKVPVDTSQVKAAKKDVDFLNKALQESEKHDLKPGGEGLEESSVLIQKVTEDIRRMKGLVSRGERQGGLLNKKQFQEAEVLSKKIGDNLGSYAEKVSKARSELAAMVKEKEKLEKAPRGFESPAAFIARQERVSHLGRQIEETRKSGQFDKRFGQIDKLSARHGTAEGDIGGFGQQGPNFRGIGRKMLGPMAGLMTGAAVWQFLKGSKELYKGGYSGGAADLSMRGGKNLLSGTYGYDPTESLGIANTIGKTTGFGGKKLNSMTEFAKEFSRSVGIGSGATTGHIGGTFQATGWQGKEYKEHLKLLRDTATALGQRGRVEEIMQGSQQLLSMAARSMGGAAVTSAEAKNLTRLQMYLESKGGMTGKGQSGIDFLAKLNQGIVSGGVTPGSKLFMHKALGGDEIKTGEDYLNFTGQMEKGIKDPQNLKKVINYLHEQFGSRKDGSLSALGQLNAKSIFGGLSRAKLNIIGGADFKDMVNQDAGDALDKIAAGGGDQIAEFEGKSATTWERANEARKKLGKIRTGRHVQKGAGLIDQGFGTLLNDVVDAGEGKAFRGRGGGYSTADIADAYEGKSGEMVKEQQRTNELLDKIANGQGKPSAALPATASSVGGSDS